MSGIAWAILAGIGFGLFQSVNRRAARAMDTYLATFVLVVVTFVFLLLVVVLRGEFGRLITMPPAAALWFGLSGLVHFFFGWTLLSMSQKSIGASRTGALIGTTPFFATILAAIFLREYLSVTQLIGIATIVVGVYFVTSR